MMAGMNAGIILINNKALVNFLTHSLCVCTFSKCDVICIKPFALNLLLTQHVLLIVLIHLPCLFIFCLK